MIVFGTISKIILLEVVMKDDGFRKIDGTAHSYVLHIPWDSSYGTNADHFIGEAIAELRKENPDIEFQFIPTAYTKRGDMEWKLNTLLAIGIGIKKIIY